MDSIRAVNENYLNEWLSCSMFREKLSALEKFILALVAIILLTGILLYFIDVARFEWYVQEDNLVEWLTVLGLLAASFICFTRFFYLLKKRNWWFLLVTFLIGIFLFFVAGEEISWGQRIFGIESSEYFQKNNAQGETNLHNLVVNGVKINKLVFTAILGTAIALYLIVFPWLYAKNEKARRLIDRSGIPVARLYQVIAIVVAALLTTIIQHGKNAELLEACACLLFFLVIRYPVNLSNFQKDQGL